MAAVGALPPAADRMVELKQFDNTKAGVKGLVDSGLTKIPRIFVLPLEDLPNPSEAGIPSLQVPVIDLGNIDEDLRRKEIVKEVLDASATWGFFQAVNHGVPISVLNNMIQGTRNFHEGDLDVKARLYSRDSQLKVKYSSNFDLYQSAVANWRDSLTCTFDGSLDPNDLPSVCREAIMDYREHVLGAVEIVRELLSEAIGLSPDYLRNMSCNETQVLVAHYYPPCPEPELAVGTGKHTDPSFLTIVLQDGLGGLQVLHQGHWVDVAPVPGALVVNIGDLLQLVSNGKLKSVAHRVLASSRGPRISTAMCLHPNLDDKQPYGPIKELLSDGNPPVYREFLVSEYMEHYISKGITVSASSAFRL